MSDRHIAHRQEEGDDNAPMLRTKCFQLSQILIAT
jgi:hypothetical protein